LISTNVSLRKVVELLTSIGYEPYISLNDLKRRPGIQKSLIYQLGIAGFCFANIMLMSFPEYLGLEASEKSIQGAFRIFNLLLALPVVLYCAQPFYISGWKGLSGKFLNIDAPIALAIIVTFLRSIYEVLSGTGAGYFDSLSGIVFFMLVGRVLQDKTYRQLTFERDFTSYFPIAVSVLKDGRETPTALPQIKNGDTLLIHNEELIPADGILTRGKALIDYSFVTGESIPVHKEMGEIVYAGGKQTGSAIEILVIKEVAQSYLTRLWSKDEFKKVNQQKGISFVHLLSRYFTYIVLGIAFLGALYWSVTDGTKVWNVVTAVLIVACPCALLLSNTFTNGNILRILGNNGFYLRGAQTIENIADVNHIVFDKTGTLTSTQNLKVSYTGISLTPGQEECVAALASQSNHPLSRAIADHFKTTPKGTVQYFKDIPGGGIKALVNDRFIALGSEEFILGTNEKKDKSCVYVSIDNKAVGFFSIQNHYREKIQGLLRSLSKKYQLSVISGDNEGERKNLQQMLGTKASILFYQTPEDKMNFIREQQGTGGSVMMVGDGLNDAGALLQSNIGIAVAEDYNNFTPASDAILDARELPRLLKFMQLCTINKRIVMASFIISIVYNIIGIFFAVQGKLSPLTAAILMPSSSLSILLITFGASSLAAKWKKLQINNLSNVHPAN
jgi:Cu+-exporting ATPase